MANKKVKKETRKFDFSDSANAIKKTAQTINSQVKEAAAEIAEDLKDNGAQLRTTAMAPVKKAYNKVTDKVNLNNLTKAAKSANDYTVKTAEEIVDGVMVNGEKWQGVAEKAVKGGLKLAAKQQEMMFGTLETVMGQLSQSSKRFKKLFAGKSKTA